MTTSISELANVPREIQLEGTTLKVRQLKIKEMFGYFEEKLRNKKLKEANEIAASLSGDDKTNFLLNVWKNLPTGQQLTDLIVETMCSMDGVSDIIYLACKEYHPEKSMDEIKNLVSVENLPQLTAVVKWINGQSDEIEEVTDKEDTAEKKI